MFSLCPPPTSTLASIWQGHHFIDLKISKFLFRNLLLQEPSQTAKQAFLPLLLFFFFFFSSEIHKNINSTEQLSWFISLFRNSKHVASRLPVQWGGACKSYYHLPPWHPSIHIFQGQPTWQVHLGFTNWAPFPGQSAPVSISKPKTASRRQSTTNWKSDCVGITSKIHLKYNLIEFFSSWKTFL